MTDDTILIVDDSPFMLRTMSFILEKAGYATATANSGQEALAKARTLHPRLILLDAVMPDMDGQEVLEVIRNDPALHGTRVVIVSGSEADELPHAVGYVQKPFTSDQILATVAALLQS